MNDSIVPWGKGSLIQHGKLSERVYLMKLHKSDFPQIIPEINQLARTEGYTKIFCKVPEWAAPTFISDGFITEAVVPGFFNNTHAAFFVSKFLNSDRLLGIEHDMLKSLTNVLSDAKVLTRKKDDKIKIKKMEPEQAEELTELYKVVFETYPFPIHQPAYIRKTMKEGVQYFGIKKLGKLIALSSAEVDKKSGNAEMTDFATLPEYRGKNLSVMLLHEMEKKMKKEGIDTFYTIARLNSIAMNKTFLKAGYQYAGTLIKNTNISGKIESMNVLYKPATQVE